MERLSDATIEIINMLHREQIDYNSEYLPLIDAVNRLYAYEDTGLEPDEIKKRNAEYIELTEMTYGPLHQKMGQWLRANMDGRLVVLPCKKGDTLFVLTWDSLSGIEETKCRSISIINREDGPCAKITARCVYDDWGGAVREYFPEDFGKKVFLTRNEAEAAQKLKEES